MNLSAIAHFRTNPYGHPCPLSLTFLILIIHIIGIREPGMGSAFISPLEKGERQEYAGIETF
jgi:hypothetical protein